MSPLHDPLFFRSKVRRGRRCQAKDDIIERIIKSLVISDPTNYTAALMPCTEGPELERLERRGTRPCNMYGIENDPEILKAMKRCLDIRLPPYPMDAHNAVDWIEAETPSGLDFIYGDFFSRPDFNHLLFLEKLFAFGMPRRGAKLVLTYGRTRCHTHTRLLNDMFLAKQPKRVVPTIAFVDLMLEKTGHRWYRGTPKEHVYKSQREDGTGMVLYVTTEFDF